MARLTEKDVTMKALVAKFNVELDEKDAEIAELKKENSAINKELKSVRRGMSLYITDDKVKKKVLELRAKYFSPIKIKDTLQHTGIDIKLDSIKDIVNNIDELQTEYIIYYKEKCEEFEKEIKINPQLLKQSSINEIIYLIDKTMESIEEASDNSERDKYVKTYRELLATKSTILKDVVFGEEEKGSDITIVNTMSDDYEEQKSNIFKIRIDEDVKVIN